MVQIINKLQIIAGDKIIPPGCEPTSALTSVTLSRNSRCCGATVDLADALEAIPGSYVELGFNFIGSGRREKWFVLPPITPECPCQSYDDYYEILRGLSCNTDEEITVAPCYVDTKFCPDPDFGSIKKPPTSTYFDEGSVPQDAYISVNYQTPSYNSERDPYDI